MPFTCSFVNDITTSCLLFFMDLTCSVMVSLLLLIVINMECSYNMFYVAELSASEHLFEISAI